MGADYLTGSATVSDHDVTLTLVGEIEDLRPRLIEAMQTLGYRMLGEQPLYAKRGARGSARWDCSFEVLDYPTKLTLALKQINDVAVAATFNYEIKSYMRMTKGDRKTLDREAQAIVALASQRLSISACSGCGTQVTDDSHFCRRCGAPLLADIAELEVLRLTKKTRAAHHNLVIGAVALFLTVLFLLPLLWVEGPKFYKPLLWIGSACGSFGLLALLQGIWQLHRTLNSNDLKDAVARPRPAFTTPHTAALPRSSGRASVTEGTTELLVPDGIGSERPMPEPVPRKSADTGEVGDERLM